MQNPIPISAVIITFNEEKNIERCLRSLQGIADEIVVLDSFSTDRTGEICRAFGVRFYQHAFDGHIEQKNRAITFASHPHILSLDADEALSETLRESILKVKTNWTADGYYMNRLTNYCGQWIHHSGWYPDRKLRLWDARKGKWGGVNPHDRFELAGGDKNTLRLDGDLLHYSYYSEEELRRQTRYFAEIAARQLQSRGKKPGMFKPYFKTAVKFARNYIFKLGFLDGKAGLTICRMAAYGTYLKYKKS
ncbi:MAG TPA: glycosyltransferase family 2 protein [Bacteroidales bacterium]|nr:glycosyltransferase family 2 protein [Bacteroidales bacterium]